MYASSAAQPQTSTACQMPDLAPSSIHPPLPGLQGVINIIQRVLTPPGTSVKPPTHGGKPKPPPKGYKPPKGKSPPKKSPPKRGHH
jgi:hypothetical protein